MKKTYNIPTMRVRTFCVENVVTSSGSYSDPNKTVEENLTAYISDKNLTAVEQIIQFTW